MTAGLLARGSSPRAAFPGRQCPVAIGSRLVAHSCGDSRGFGAGPAPHSLLALPFAGKRPSRRAFRPRPPLLSITADDAEFRFAAGGILAMNCRSAVPAREPRGNAVRIVRSKAVAAPATVSGKFAPNATEARCFGKAGTSIEPQARRPAAGTDHSQSPRVEGERK